MGKHTLTDVANGMRSCDCKRLKIVELIFFYTDMADWNDAIMSSNGGAAALLNPIATDRHTVLHTGVSVRALAQCIMVLVVPDNFSHCNNRLHFHFR